MKSQIMPRLLLSLFVLFSGSMGLAQNKSGSKKINAAQDLDTLGGNEALVNMATALDPQNKSRIVQSRLVDRHNRFELGVSYGGTAGGDSYLKTQSVGAAMDFHFNPRVSVGLRYFDYGNTLTPEGLRMFEDARKAYVAGGRSYSIPDIDYPLRSAMGVISWYPIYGKMNLLDAGIAQFDVYMLAGGGQIQLSSGWTSALTGGAGFGVWLTRNLSARAEIKYQTYKDQLITGSRQIHATVGTIGIGLML